MLLVHPDTKPYKNLKPAASRRLARKVDLHMGSKCDILRRRIRAQSDAWPELLQAPPLQLRISNGT